MTAQSWQTLGTIIAIAGGVIMAMLAAKSNSRDASRERQAAIDRHVAEARAPLIAEVTRLEGVVNRMQAEKQLAEERAAEDRRAAAEDRRAAGQRINELQDRLYRRDDL